MSNNRYSRHRVEDPDVNTHHCSSLGSVCESRNELTKQFLEVGPQLNGTRDRADFCTWNGVCAVVP